MNVHLSNTGAGENKRFNQSDFRLPTVNPSTIICSKDCNKRVQFAATEARHADCDGLKNLQEHGTIDSAEAARRRSQIWYSKKDYEEFRSDRVATIRMFRSVQGDMDEVLEEFYCLRGLEPFHSPSLQSELRVHRAIYVDAVLSEQRRAKLEKIRNQVFRGVEENGTGEEISLAHAIRHRIEHVSKWSMQRAQRLAVLDEIEAKRINGRNDRRRSSWASTQECKKRRCDGSRILLQNGSENKKSFSVTSQVNLSELKEMNRRLLEEMGIKSLRSFQQLQVSKFCPSGTEMMSLNSLMRASISNTTCETKLLPPLSKYLYQDPRTIGNSQITTGRLEEQDAVMTTADSSPENENLVR